MIDHDAYLLKRAEQDFYGDLEDEDDRPIVTDDEIAAERAAEKELEDESRSTY